MTSERSKTYEKVVTPSSGLRLHLNENTAGCSPRVFEALHAITRQRAALYPDYDTARQATATRLAVPVERSAFDQRPRRRDSRRRGRCPAAARAVRHCRFEQCGIHKP